MHIVRGTICVSQRLFQQGRQTVNCKLLLSNRRFPVQTVSCGCGSVLKFIFLNSNHWVGILGFQRIGKLRLFLQDTRVKRTTHANRMLRALEWIQACFGVETFFSSVRPVPSQWIKVLQRVSVFCQNLLVWPRWKCWF